MSNNTNVVSLSEHLENRKLNNQRLYFNYEKHTISRCPPGVLSHSFVCRVDQERKFSWIHRLPFLYLKKGYRQD